MIVSTSTEVFACYSASCRPPTSGGTGGSGGQGPATGAAAPSKHLTNANKQLKPGSQRVIKNDSGEKVGTIKRLSKGYLVTPDPTNLGPDVEQVSTKTLKSAVEFLRSGGRRPGDDEAPATPPPAARKPLSPAGEALEVAQASAAAKLRSAASSDPYDSLKAVAKGLEDGAISDINNFATSFHPPMGVKGASAEAWHSARADVKSKMGKRVKEAQRNVEEVLRESKNQNGIELNQRDLSDALERNGISPTSSERSLAGRSINVKLDYDMRIKAADALWLSTTTPRDSWVAYAQLRDAYSSGLADAHTTR